MIKNFFNRLWKVAQISLKRVLSVIAQASVFRRKVPLILQLNIIECGAACLAMILSYYHRKTRVTEIREICNMGRDGMTAHDIVQTGRDYGFNVRAYSVQDLDDIRFLRVPAILHWKFNHFVVLERWLKRRAVILDPAIGRLSISRQDFEHNFTGIILVFEPRGEFMRTRNGREKMHGWEFLKSLMKLPGVTHIGAQIAAASLLLQVFGLLPPILTQIFVDTIIPYQVIDLTAIISYSLLLVVVTNFCLSFLRGSLLIHLQAKLDSQLMMGFFEHLLSLPFRFFQERASGDLLMRLGSNAMIREVITSQSLSILLDGGMVIVFLSILTVRAPLYGALTIALGLSQILILLVTTGKIQNLIRLDLEAQSVSHSFLVEAIKGIATVKTTSSEAQTFNHWANLFVNQLNITVRRNYLTMTTGHLLSIFRYGAPLLLLLIGAQQAIQGYLSLGTMLALNSLAIACLNPLVSFVTACQQLLLVRAHLERILDVLEAQPEFDENVSRKHPFAGGQIELRNIHFSYSASGPKALRNISIRILPGQKVALVGQTGSGKTTLGMLLLGLYQPTEGEVLYDGIPLTDLNRQKLRRQFGVILQDAFLFNRSIRQNIASTNPDISLNAVIEAAQIAGIHEEILNMPMGYETMVGEGGFSLSGGQRQRLSIARALVNKPTVLLMDEATNHLDSITEKQIEKNLKDLHCTRIVITHRINTVADADLILVLDKGQIVESGRHEELILKGGAYVALIHNQPWCGQGIFSLDPYIPDHSENPGF